MPFHARITVNDKMTIFDCNTAYVDRNYIWTAITRSSDFNNVQIYQHSRKEVENLDQSRMMLYFESKINDYKTQDKKASRNYKKIEYVDVDWIINQYNRDMGNYCCGCNEKFILGFCDGSIETNITVDRIDNSLPHMKTNCRLLCLHCNVTRADHY